MLQLTPQQNETLNKLETASFSEFCSRVGKDPANYATSLRDVLADELNMVINTAGENIPQSFADYYRTAVQENNLFKQIKIVETHANATRLSHIIEGAPRNMFDYSYLSSLAVALGLPLPSPGDNSALRTLLDSLPLRLYWGNNFNAFVMRETLLGNIPCICVYHTITSGLKALTDLVATAIIEIGDPLPIVINCKNIRNDTTFKADCRKALMAIFGEGELLIPLHKQHVYRYRGSTQFSLYANLTAGAFDFVWLHEYGHLLLGHLLKERSHHIEFEADKFSVTTLFQCFNWFPKYEELRATDPETLEKLIDFDRTFYLFGAGLSLSVLCLFDLFHTEDSLTHPTGKARIDNIAKLYPQIDIMSFIRNVYHAINPTLREYWGVTAKID